MPVHPCLPMHITVLYLTTVINITLLLNLALVDATVLVSGNENQTKREFYDQPAGFGPAFPDGGLVGLTVESDPVNGCTTLAEPPAVEHAHLAWIAVIQRGGCAFDRKVMNAQDAGYSAAIVYNVNGSSSLIPMGGDPFNQVAIPSCFVGYSDGRLLAHVFNYSSGYIVTIDNDTPFDGAYYLFPLAVVLGVCFILMLIFMIVKWLRDVHKKRKSRLSKSQLAKIPTKKFKKGDRFDVCAVCLDDYEENQELRVLPCSHVYHIKCIDPWLLQNKPTCPICKRKVVKNLPDPEADTESDADEDTPLIRPGSSGRPRSFGATNEAASSEPSTVNYDDVSDSDLSDYDTPHVMTNDVSPDDDVTGSDAMKAEPKSGLPEEKKRLKDLAASQQDEIEVDDETPGTSGLARGDSPSAGVHQGSPDKGGSRKGSPIPVAPAVPSDVAPGTPLEPEVVVQNPRYSINGDGRDVDGVV